MAEKSDQMSYYVGRYILLDKIDQGSQSIIYLGFCDGNHFGIKIYKHGVQGSETFRNEVLMLTSISHNSWVQPYDVCYEESCRLPDCEKSQTSCLVMEYYRNGDLRKYLKYAPFPLPICRRVMVSLLEALIEIRNKGIIHRDIKPENILVSDNFQIKLIDLGLAIKQNQEQHDIVGTLPFIAPEIFRKKIYSHKSDLFAIGVLFFIMAMARYPFKEAKLKDPSFFLFTQKDNEKFWHKFPKHNSSTNFKNFINKILAFEKDGRPEIEELLNMDQMRQEIASKEELQIFFAKFNKYEN